MKSYNLVAAGGPYGDVGRTSPAFSPLVNGLLAGLNPLLQPGYSLYSQYLREAFALIDAGDPVNFIKKLAQDRPVLFTKVVNDTVVPNATTDFLIGSAGGSKVSATGLQPVAAGAPKYVTFLTGTHSMLLDPGPNMTNLAGLQEMQTHAASLVATGGTAFQVVNSALLRQ